MSTEQRAVDTERHFVVQGWFGFVGFWLLGGRRLFIFGGRNQGGLGLWVFGYSEPLKPKSGQGADVARFF